MVLGDSFAFGIFLRKDFSLPCILEKRLEPEYKVFNLSMPAWGIDQMYLAYKKYAPIINPDIVILVFIIDDVHRVSRFYNKSTVFYKPAFEIKNNRLVKRSESNSDLFDKIAQKSYLINWFYCKFYKYHHAKKITELIFMDLAKITRERGQELIIVKYPCLYEFESKGWKIPLERSIMDLGAFCKGRNIKFLDAYGPISALDYRERSKFYLFNNSINGSHPSQYGNEYLADLLVNKFFKR